jgi:putative flippase GtrA
MKKEIVAGIICISLILVYNGLLKTNLSNRCIAAILGSLLGIAFLLAIPLQNIKWLLSIKVIILIGLIISCGFVFYKARIKK